MKHGWNKWVKLSKKIATVQVNVLLFLFYFALIVPMGIFLNLFFKNVLLGHRYQKGNNTYWIKRKKLKQNLVFAREQ